MCVGFFWMLKSVPGTSDHDHVLSGFVREGEFVNQPRGSSTSPCSIQLGIICTCYHILGLYQINTDQGTRVLLNHHFINTIVILVHGYEQGSV